MSDRDSTIRHPLPPPTSLSYAGSIPLERLWAEDNERDPAQHAALVKLQGCPPSRAESAWARQQSRQAASKNRHWRRSMPEQRTDPVADAVSAKDAIEHILRTATDLEADLITHHFLLGKPMHVVADDTGHEERTLRAAAVVLRARVRALWQS